MLRSIGKKATLDDKNVETLTQLGLTSLQAKVYLTLAGLGSSPIQKISIASQIDRAHVYQVINKLFKIGLVKKTLGKPNLFNSIPLREGLNILLERKTAEWSEVRKKTKKIIGRSNENNSKVFSCEEKLQVTLIPGKETDNREFARVLTSTQISCDGVFMREEDYCLAFLGSIVSMKHKPIHTSLLKRGVNLRFVVCRSDNENLPRKKTAERIKSLNKIGKGSISIRFTSLRSPVMFGVIDGKELYTHLGSANDWKEKPSLYSNNPSLVALAQGFFEYMWQSSQEENDP
jgi:sugar-specific transcriptional regulator TrmB